MRAGRGKSLPPKAGVWKTLRVRTQTSRSDAAAALERRLDGRAFAWASRLWARSSRRRAPVSDGVGLTTANASPQRLAMTLARLVRLGAWESASAVAECLRPQLELGQRAVEIEFEKMQRQVSRLDGSGTGGGDAEPV